MYSIVMKGQRPSKYAKRVYDKEVMVHYRAMKQTNFNTKEEADQVMKAIPENMQKHMMVCETMIL